MSLLFFFAVLLLTALLATEGASSQIRWTPQQKAVWQTETAVAGALTAGEAPWQYFDQDCVSWPGASPVPLPGTSMERWAKFSLDSGSKPVFIDLVPRVIWVRGDCAYVDYHRRTVVQDRSGKQALHDSHWMDVLVKRGGKWLIAGEAGGADEKAAQGRLPVVRSFAQHAASNPAGSARSGLRQAGGRLRLNHNLRNDGDYTTYIGGRLGVGLGL